VHFRRGALVLLAAVLLVLAIQAQTPVLTPALTPSATLVPTPMATPVSTPTSTPVSTPTAPPSGTPVPASIDATGATDASAALQSWLDSVPDGTTIVFAAGATYRMDTGLQVDSDRHDVTFDGNGATLASHGDTTSGSSLFVVSGTGIKIRDFNLIGNSPTPGTYRSGEEYAYGIQTYGASDVEIADVTISAVYGDGLMVGGWSDTVWFHDSHVVSAGRNGVTILAGRNVTIERVAFDTSGWATFDIEPWEASGGAHNVTFRDNTAGTWNGRWNGREGFFFAAGGVAGSVVSDVTVSGNTITGSPLTTHVTVPRRQNITFTDNTSTVPAAGPVLTFAHVDGLTVTGNAQPLTSGDLASISDCTAVTYP
jgi:hypothetical protein